MNIVIIGWYGTETLGDCAILDGILSVIESISTNCIVYIGSLYPMLSERTLFEEKLVFMNSAPRTSIVIFDVKDNDILNKTIKESELLVMGGGPICDIPELYIIRKAFAIAYEYDIPRLIMGCGLDPLINEEYISITRDILELSTGISFRDYKSLEITNKLFNTFDKNIDIVGDPAVISIENFISLSEYEHYDYLAVHFWNPLELDEETNIKMKNDYIQFLKVAAQEYEKIILIPMSTFFVGGDDRFLYSVCKLELNEKKLVVCHKPMNLYELYRLYGGAKACFAVRHHAVLMQTILNGNNFIYDYTHPVYGKTGGFIDSLENKEFYQNRYYSIYSNTEFDPIEAIDILSKNNRYEYSVSGMKDLYCKWINRFI